MASIRNTTSLVGNGQSDSEKKLREVALSALEEALNGASPRTMVLQNVQRMGQNTLRIGGDIIDLSRYVRMFVIGCGKASASLAEALEPMIEDRLDAGIVIIPRGTKNRFKQGKIELVEANHPIPDEDGVTATKRIVKLLEDLNERDIVFCLISGGGSALMTLPKEGISLKDKQHISNLLLKSGANIFELNCVRKHISQVKGGQLASKAYPATLFSLILSDVVGDALDVIASGPTAPDTTTYQDAVNILRRYLLWKETPRSIRKNLQEGVDGRLEETPKEGHEVFKKVHNLIIGSNRSASNSALVKTASQGFNTLHLTSSMQGEARHVGTALASVLRELVSYDNPIAKPACIIAGGETTVTVQGNGVGGRNQELVLSACLQIAGLRHVVIASMGTDGIDGPTDAAGAIADGQTITKAERLNLDPSERLRVNDSYRFFQELGDLIITGPTGTNVGDIMILLAS